MVAEQEHAGAIDRMAAGIAHDLNNSLAPVVGFSELLLNDATNAGDGRGGGGGLSSRQREWLELIHRGAMDAARTVSRLRQVYHPRASQEDYRLVDAAELARHVVTLTRPTWQDEALASGKSISVLMDLQPVPPLLGDPADLREALSNLIGNAADAILNTGTLTVRTSWAGERAIALEVADTGRGMSEEDQRRCMEPFFTTKGARSTGLGLSLVHGAAQRHGGRVEVESHLGVGTTVRLILPLPEGAAQIETSG